MNWKENLLGKFDRRTNVDQDIASYYHSFYKPKLDKDGNLKDIIIDRVKLLELLKDFGFYRYDLGFDTYCFVLITDNKVKEVSVTYIIDWWFQFLEDIPNYF